MSSNGNAARVARGDLGRRRDELRRLQGGSLRERVFPGVVVGVGGVAGYEVAILQPNGEASVRTWNNVLPVLPGAEFEADDRVMLVWREGSETPRIQAGGGGGGGDGEGGLVGYVRFLTGS